MTLADQDRRARRFEQIVGNSAALRVVLEQAKRVAAADSTVLIQGETGTGKELIAHAIHNASPRSGHPLIKLNCAAIPFDLLESELFGHERGAFTGAIAQKIGRFELADTGTLFLSDLYYRLNVFPVTLPPLRERRQDIRPLMDHYVEMFSCRMGKRIDTIPDEFINAFESYSWPGNVRELQNVIERAVILSNDGLLPNLLRPTRADSVVAFPAGRTLRESERLLILGALEATGWLVGGPYGAAARLGMKRTTLIARMKKHGILRPSDENRNEATLADSPTRLL